jgi:hypothetical protein
MSMDELNEEQKLGAWRREAERLRVEIMQRFIKLRNEGIVPTPAQLEQWLSSLGKGLSVQLGHDKDDQGVWHYRRRS